MTEDAGDELARVIGAGGLSGAGALGLYWLAGPTIQAVGKAFGDWTDWRLRNLLGLGEKVQARRDTAEDDAGNVHPKVVREIFDRGSWTDDDVSQEYLAGLLCSSRCVNGDDEEAAYLSQIVAGLTATQIRLHHAIYSALNGHGSNGYALSTQETAKRYTVFIPMGDTVGLLPQSDRGDFVTLRSAVHALAREGLVGQEFGVGADTSYLAQFFPPKAGPGLMVYPTSLGVDIFFRAYGLRLTSHNLLLEGVALPELSTDMPTSPEAIVGAGRLD